ncbi:conserved hypothetical protein [uncultured Desulfobacterium sp.]|uniref:DUF2062 domain-containing protein n=1 Tax=uncultured Desulfobacterium sp. TaxID=201089 RepID=A0A445N2J4_9BACT|nr:conserved hypothetical protein [uncultured Desulfobacterium sp.]
MVIQRQIRYYYLRLMRLRGDPHDLALGMALGVFSGMMPTLPFHTVIAVALAVFLKASKITAALGTWVSNPLNWCILYYLNYKLGSFCLGIPEQESLIASVICAVKSDGESIVVMKQILGAGGMTLAAFLVGGLIMGIASGIPSYFIFLRVFKYIRVWREKRKKPRDQ